MRLRGTVKWFSGTRHFGFIDASDGRGVFVHQAHVQGHQVLSSGDLVSFYLTTSAKGLSATAVERIEQTVPPIFQDLDAARREVPAE